MNLKSMFTYLYNASPIKRVIILWIVIQLLMWSVFGVSFLLNRDAWSNVVEAAPGSAAVGGLFTTFLFIIVSNFFICVLIAIGNLFVKFGILIPGLLILLWQAVSIGWLAGSNGFEIPFVSVLEANIQYLKIGLWETTAYVTVCAITLTKSLFVADTFPAKKWSEIRTFKDIALNKDEIILLLVSLILLIGAAGIEAFALI